MNTTANKLNKLNLSTGSILFLVYFFIIVLLGRGREVFMEKIKAV
ncbi:MAG: hypothetical protein V2A55_02675 [Candidatus Jorgensenbacteria bacterium]